ncbi:hypothetical protein [Alistipes sp.]|uniref:hypothetical protein n=1 Tax=Alistipes sp. TaxID=1872444 RepID=UPI003AF08D57
MKWYKILLFGLVGVLCLSCDSDKEEFRMKAGDLLNTAWQGQVNWYENGKVYYTKNVSFQFSSEKTGISKSVTVTYPDYEPFITSFEYQFDGKCLKYARGDGHLEGSWFVISAQPNKLELHSDLYENVSDRGIMILDRVY